MNRSSLVWFAAGAAASSAVALASTLLKSEPVTFTAFLVLEEPFVLKARGQMSDMDMIADQTGELLRSCRAKSFETTFLYDDHSPTADLPLIQGNAQAFDCVLEEANSRDLRLSIDLRRD